MKKIIFIPLFAVLSLTLFACSLINKSSNTSLESEANTKSAKNENVSNYEPQVITAEIAGKYAIYAMMASNSYHKNDRVRFAVEKAGWIQVDKKESPTMNPTKEHPLSGLAYDIFQKQGTSDVVFAIRGTDNKLDYLTANLAVPPFSRQYSQVNKAVGRYLKKHKDKNVIVTGHSLGGGLALSVSVHHGVDAITFDPSPRIFDGLGDKHLPAKRIVIYEAGEILEKVRKHWKKIHEVVSSENIYKCSFDFGGVSKHRGDYLALGLLKLGATVNQELNPILKALPQD